MIEGKVEEEWIHLINSVSDERCSSLSHLLSQFYHLDWLLNDVLILKQRTWTGEWVRRGSITAGVRITVTDEGTQVVTVG